MGNSISGGRWHVWSWTGCRRLQQEYLVLVGPTSGTSYNSALKLQKATLQLGDIPLRQIEKILTKNQACGKLPARVRTALYKEAQQSQHYFSK